MTEAARRLAVLALALLPGLSAGRELVTEHYRVSIEPLCEEGNVTCDRVRYTGTHRTNGDRIELTGGTWHARCADGATPCRFLGYRFDNGDHTYRVHETGLLEVIRDGSRVLLSEQGRWR